MHNVNIIKEAYAIEFCCKSLEAQIRDRKFTILTDHKNLTIMKEESTYIRSAFDPGPTGV